jgi:hypothetical protein
MSFSGNCDIRIKIALKEPDLHVPTIIGLWPAANFHEREAWDMFGVVFDGHPNLSRIYTPPTWKGHPLRKDHASDTDQDSANGPAQLVQQLADFTEPLGKAGEHRSDALTLLEEVRRDRDQLADLLTVQAVACMTSILWCRV